MNDKEKLLKLINRYETKRDKIIRRKNDLIDEGITGGVVFERLKTKEKDYYYMIQNLNMILNDCESEFY